MDTTSERVWLSVNGQRKLVGELEDRVFRKRVHGSRHFLRKPQAICLDAEVWSHIQPQVDLLEVVDIESHLTYQIAASVFEARRITIDRGHGVQYAAPLDLWSKA